MHIPCYGGKRYRASDHSKLMLTWRLKAEDANGSGVDLKLK